jgi:hypothetical protein
MREVCALGDRTNIVGIYHRHHIYKSQYPVRGSQVCLKIRFFPIASSANCMP